MVGGDTEAVARAIYAWFRCGTGGVGWKGSIIIFRVLK